MNGRRINYCRVIPWVVAAGASAVATWQTVAYSVDDSIRGWSAESWITLPSKFTWISRGRPSVYRVEFWHNDALVTSSFSVLALLADVLLTYSVAVAAGMLSAALIQRRYSLRWLLMLMLVVAVGLGAVTVSPRFDASPVPLLGL